MPTEDVMWFDVQCESSYMKGAKNWGMFLIIVSFLLPFAFFIRLLGLDMLTERTERVGRDVVIAIPLKVAKDLQTQLRRSSQGHLRTVLCSVPIYQSLFENYPAARIHPRQG
jgi:hypothetical protein